jgi:hypothetical protein
MQSSVSTYLAAYAEFSPQSSNERTQDQPTAPTQSPGAIPGPPDAIDWTRLKGFELPPRPSKTSRTRRSPVWDHGWRIHNINENVDYWLCRRCHLDKSKPQSHMLVCTHSTSSSISHLRYIHGVHLGEHEAVEPPQTQQNPSAPVAAITPRPTSGLEPETLEFDLVRFLHLMLRLFVKQGLPFELIESPEFKQLMIYTNPKCKEFLPSAAELHELYALHEPHL